MATREEASLLNRAREAVIEKSPLGLKLQFLAFSETYIQEVEKILSELEQKYKILRKVGDKEFENKEFYGGYSGYYEFKTRVTATGYSSEEASTWKTLLFPPSISSNPAITSTLRKRCRSDGNGTGIESGAG